MTHIHIEVNFNEVNFLSTVRNLNHRRIKVDKTPVRRLELKKN